MLILFINQTLQDTVSSGQNPAAKTNATLTEGEFHAKIEAESGNQEMFKIASHHHKLRGWQQTDSSSRPAENTNTLNTLISDFLPPGL